MNPWLAVVLITTLVSAVTAALGVVTSRILARRSVSALAWVVPLTAVAAVVVSVAAAAKLMFLSAHDLAVVTLICLVAGCAALAAGLLVAHQVRSLERRSHELAEERARAEQAEETRRELVAWVSHDLRTPLAGMRALVEAIDDGIAPDPSRYLAALSQQLERMNAMVDDLFELSRINTGRLTLVLEQIPLEDFVADAVSTVAPLARKCGVTVVAEALRANDGPESLVVQADERALRRALVNLINNAIRHTPAEGTVKVQTRKATRSAQVSVIDQCGGLADDAISRVFEAGWRSGQARTPRSDQGAGLGLAIVEGIVQAHSGRVTVQNVVGGCRFDIMLPALG